MGKRIYCGNLSFKATEDDVRQLFSAHGEVTDVHMVMDRETGRARGFAFVEMADDDSENRAIEALQGAELMGRPLRINKAEPRTGGGGGGAGAGGPRRGGGGYGGGGGGYSGGGGAATPSAERASGARGWEDRSYGGGGGNESFGEGRSRRRRSSGDASAGDAYGGYSGAED